MKAWQRGLQPLVWASLLLAGPALADQLVLKDGTRFETQGSWVVKGRQVVYTDLQGQLMAMPLAEVDLAASQAPPPVAAPPAAAAKADPVEKKVVMTLTDKDVGHVDPNSLAPAAAGQKTVEMYSTTWCPACKKARKFFTTMEIEYSDYDVEKDEVARRRKAGKDADCGVPVIDIEGTVLCGFNPKAILEALGIKLPPRPQTAPPVAEEGP